MGPAGFTRLLLSREERAQVPLPIQRRKVPGGSSRVRYMADAVKKDAIAWLFRAGGWQRRAVVTSGRRREGRLTDAGIFERLDVRFTPASLRLLLAAMEDPAALPAVEAPLVAALERGAGGATPATGDLVAVHRIVTALFRDAGGAPAAREVAPEVLSGPLRQLRTAIPGCRRVWIAGPDGATLASDEDAPEDPAWGQAVQQALSGRAPEEGAGWVRATANVLLRAVDGGVRAWIACALEGKPAGVKAALESSQASGAQAQLARVLGRGTPRAVVESRRRDLLRLSPLTRLFSLEEVGAGSGNDEAVVATAAKTLAPLFAGDRAVLWTYLDRTLARAWLDEESDRRRATGPDAHPRYAAAARGAGAFAAAAVSAGRPDALRPLVRFFKDYVLRFGNRAPVVEALHERSLGFDKASERDAFKATCSRLFGVSRHVSHVIERTLGTPVIDRAEEEKVLLGDWHDGFKQVADEMEALRRELAGEIG